MELFYFVHCLIYISCKILHQVYADLWKKTCEKTVIMLPVCWLILETCLRKSFMFLRADMTGKFSELATGDKEQTVANPIILESKLDCPHTVSQFMWNMQEFSAKPVNDNLAILSSNLNWWSHQQWNSALNRHKRNAQRNISAKNSNYQFFTYAQVITNSYGVIFLVWTQRNYWKSNQYVARIFNDVI